MSTKIRNPKQVIHVFGTRATGKMKALRKTAQLLPGLPQPARKKLQQPCAARQTANELGQNSGPNEFAVWYRVRDMQREQREKLKLGRLPFVCSSPVVDDARKLQLLVSALGHVAAEVGNVERAGEGTKTAAKAFLREELLQLVAHGTSWLEVIQAMKKAE